MLEINDHYRLVKHNGSDHYYWIAQQLLEEKSSYRREIWKPVTQPLTTSQAECWLNARNASPTAMLRFRKAAAIS